MTDLTSDLRSNQRLAPVLAATAAFKALTDQQRERYFSPTERCRAHGDYRCHRCALEAKKS